MIGNLLQSMNFHADASASKEEDRETKRNGPSIEAVDIRNYEILCPYGMHRLGSLRP